MLVELIANAVRDALPQLDDPVKVVRLPASDTWDFATPAALALGKPHELAERLNEREEFAYTAVTGAGFVNLRLRPEVFVTLLAAIVQAGPTYGGTAALESVEAKRAQYAHALLARIQRNAEAIGLTGGATDLAVLDERPERTLLATLGEYPAVLDRATRATSREPLVALLDEIADLVPRFVEDRLAVPRGDDAATPAHRTRLVIVEASRVVLANGLASLSTPAPDRL